MKEYIHDTQTIRVKHGVKHKLYVLDDIAVDLGMFIRFSLNFSNEYDKRHTA